jgi:hypothetical protein
LSPSGHAVCQPQSFTPDGEHAWATTTSSTPSTSVQRQYGGVKRNHDQIRSLRDAHQATAK